MKRLDGEVTRLGQRVSEAENVNAVLEQKLADLRNGVAGASAAGVSEIPKEAPVVGELPLAKRLASTSDAEKQWKHPEAKAGETATSRGGLRPCQNCHGGTVLDLSLIHI